MKIYVIGIGDAGINIISRMKIRGVNSNIVKTILLGSTYSSLMGGMADHKILLQTPLLGHGAGGKPEIGERAMSIARDKIIQLIQEPDFIFIVAGMGGGTGTGGAPVLARILSENFPHAVIIGVATFPFRFERARLKIASEGIQRFMKEVHTLVLIDNNKLMEYYPNMSISKAFEIVDNVVINAVEGLVSVLTEVSLINVDLADMRALLSKGGLIMISIGEGTGVNRVRDAIESTLSHPLLDVDYEGAKGAIIHLTISPDVQLAEVTEVANSLTRGITEMGEVKMGVRVRDDLKDMIRVTMFSVGVKSPQLLGNEE
ncbi:MAG: cell division FtsZ family protein [Candidatus Micrarchaeota archaeon]|nr:cell division FtsZ family protein [Candidatus Micrarchaeota archaeon]MCX8154250.1 cell division FtsZ family protein [Candidatus Micrarchaeota archaeon]